MAKSWKEISALPAYRGLDPSAQERVRQSYFQEVIAPTVPYADLDTAKNAFEAESAPPKQNSSFLGDTVDLTQRGFLNSLGGVMDFVGADSAAQYLYDQGEKQRQTMTPETQAALEQPLFDDQGDYYLGEGATSPRAWLAQGIETLGGSALPIPGGALAKAALRPLLGLGKTARAIKGGLMAEGLGAGAATRTARQLAPDWRDTAAMVGGYGGMEGAVSAGLNEQQVREQVAAMPQADLEQSPDYWQAMQEVGGDPVAARALLSERLGKSAGLKTFLPTAALGAGAGHFYDKLVHGLGSGSRLANIGKGMATEAMEEGPQSATESLAQNTTLQAVDPGIEATQGLIPNVLGGAVLGGAVGGVMAGIAPKGQGHAPTLRVEEVGPLSRAANQGADAQDAGLPATPPIVTDAPTGEGADVADSAGTPDQTQGQAQGKDVTPEPTPTMAGPGEVTDAEAMGIYDRLMAEAASRDQEKEAMRGASMATQVPALPNTAPMSERERADQARFQEQIRAIARANPDGMAEDVPGTQPETPLGAIKNRAIDAMRKGLAGGKLTKRQASSPEWQYVRAAVPEGAPMPTNAEILQLLNDFHNGVPLPASPGVEAPVLVSPETIATEVTPDVGRVQDQGEGQAPSPKTAEVKTQPPSAWEALGLAEPTAGLTTQGVGEEVTQRQPPSPEVGPDAVQGGELKPEIDQEGWNPDKDKKVVEDIQQARAQRLERLRTGPAMTAEEFQASGMGAMLEERFAASIFHEIAGGTVADADRAVKSPSLRAGVSAEGSPLVNTHQVVLLAQEQVRNLGVLGPKTRVKGKKGSASPVTHYRVSLTSPFGQFQVYVAASPDAIPGDYLKDAKAAFLHDAGAGSGFTSSEQVKTVGDPEPVTSVPEEATPARNAEWARIAKVQEPAISPDVAVGAHQEQAEANTTASDSGTAEPSNPNPPSEGERIAQLGASESAIKQAAIEDVDVQATALSVVRGHQKPELLRERLRVAILQAISDEMVKTLHEAEPGSERTLFLQALDTLKVVGEDALNPGIFTEDVLSAWEALALKQARGVLKAERMAAHEQIITDAMAKAWRDTGFWQEQQDEIAQSMERDFLAGWRHALDGGTGSNLPPGDNRTASQLRRMGYEAAASWLVSEDGKAFMTGGKPRKMEGVGEQLRRKRDVAKEELAAIDLSRDDQVEDFMTALTMATERSRLFPMPGIKTDDPPGTATPGLYRYLRALRNEILPFGEWLSRHGYGGRSKYRDAPAVAMAKAARKGQEEREQLRQHADYYIEQVSAFGGLFDQVETVAQAAEKLAQWSLRDSRLRGSDRITFIHPEHRSMAMRQLISGGEGQFGITRKLDSGGAYRLADYLPGGFKARDFSHGEDTQTEFTRNKPLKRERFDRVERTGEDYRQGRNITAEELTSTFGMKGVTYGNQVTAKQRQDHTNYTYDALMDLAKTLGIDPHYVGMGGRFTLAYGALGSGRHAAHYTPDNNGQGQAINLTNTRGDGTLAHEWFHALDWNLRDTLLSGANMQVPLLQGLRMDLAYRVLSDDDIEKELDRFLAGRVHWTGMGRGAKPIDHAKQYLSRTISALDLLINKRHRSDQWVGTKNTRYLNDALELGKDYWGNNAELIARAGEAWLYDRLEGTNNYLVSDWVEDGKIAPPGYRGTPYPSGEERAALNDAFGQFMASLRWTEEGPQAKTNTFENSPLLAKAREARDKAVELMAELDQRDALVREAKKAAHQAILARRAQQEADEAAAQAQREQADLERIKAEWQALQDQQAPTPSLDLDDGVLSLEELNALFDEADAEVTEERQEETRGAEIPPPLSDPEGMTTGPAFVDDPNAGVIQLGQRLARRDWTSPLSWRDLGNLADEVFGGSKAEGKYSPKDAYDAVELALNEALLTQPQLKEIGIQAVTGATPEEAMAGMEGLAAMDANMPTQTNRTAEQDEFQQFSTPHPHAALMARVANLRQDDVLLEPSAGSGNLVALPKLVGVERIHVNELAPRRQAILRGLGFSQVSSENAEQIGNILGPRGLRPTVVIMNPPFSASAGRQMGVRDNRIGAKHVEEALKLLAPGGRAVILMGKGYTRGAARLHQHWAWVLKNFNVRANLGLDGSQYKKFGTSFDNRLVVIDKTGPTLQPNAILTGEGLTVAQALAQLETIRNDRIHVGGRYGTESGGGQVAEAGSLLGSAVAPAPAATGAVGNGEPGSERPMGEGAGGDGGGASVSGTKRSPRSRGGRSATGGRVGTGGADTGAGSGADTGGRGGATPGATVLPGGDADAGLTASLAHAASEFAKHGVEGINEALTGLASLFGGSNRLRSFPGGIDEETYAKAKPHFEKAAQAFLAAGNDFKEFFKVLIRAFGSGIKPYALRFAQEWQQQRPLTEEPKDEAPANEPPGPVPATSSEKDVPQELGDSLYADYQPASLWQDLGAQPHPSALVESAAMAAVAPPSLGVRLQFPREVYREGRLSAAQLDAVAYTEQAHQRLLPDGSRQGFFIGDGTGVGKGREIAGILYHNWLQGRRKAVWLTVNNDLYPDSTSYLQAVAGSDLGLFNLGKVKADSQIAATEGVAFVTYPMLRGGGQGAKDETGKTVREGQKRIDQLVNWLGSDFDGVIAFDESHNMGNALETRGVRGSKPPSQVALVGVALQSRLPKARVVYVSATGATDPINLGYLTRLGLWGEGTPFANVRAFVQGIASSGLAAMEVVAKDMKAMGVYLARSLPFKEVSYAQLEHPLTDDQREMYDAIAGAWQLVLRDVSAALNDTGQIKDGRAKGNALGQFWGSQQRFFNQMLTSLQMPSVISAIEADLEAGRAPVLQFVNTNEASQEREAARLAAQERDIDELDITPRQMLLQYLENSFPVNEYETYTDDEGNERTRPVVDSQGNPVQNLEAVAKRDALMDRIAQMRFPDNPIDIIVGHFGSGKVAEITGRKRRFVRDAKTGRVTEEKRSDAIREKEVDAFQNDRRQILIFSDKGGTGKSYHADLNAKNQRKRVHYVVQPGWRADKAIQGLGRTHRTHQAQAPHVVLVMTNLKGHRRFVASIARRMDQLGALTKGQRQTGGQGLFTEEMNLETPLAADALAVLIADVLGGRVDGVTRGTLSESMGFDVEKTDKNQKQVLPTIQQFLNRILALETDRQNQLFDAFAERLAAQIEQARLNGTLDMGMENIRADKIRLISEKEVYQDPRTGAVTRLAELELTHDIRLWPFDDFMDAMLAEGRRPIFMRNRHSKHVWALTPGASITKKDGTVEEAWQGWDVVAQRGPRLAKKDMGDPANMARYPIPEETHELLELAEAKKAWNDNYATAPHYKKSTRYLLTGILLPIWDRLDDVGMVRVQRALTDDGRAILGRHVENKQRDKVLLRLTGSNIATGMTPQQIFDAVLNKRQTAVLANDWKLAPRRIADNPRIELTGRLDYAAGRLLQEQGVIYERIGYEGRYFIPTDPETGVEVLARVLNNRPVIELIGKDDDEAVAFSKAGGASATARGSVTAITQAVRRLMRNWANAPEVVVFQGLTDAQVPERVRTRYAEETAQQGANHPGAAPDLVEGFYFRGKVYINAQAVRNTADLERILRHEALGHGGLRSLFGGADLDALLDRMARARRAEVAAMAKARGLDMQDTQQRRMAAEEVLAELAQTRPEMGWVRELLALIKAKLREWGILNADALSDAEILREYVLPARNFIERGRVASQVTETLAPAFSLTETEAAREFREAEQRYAPELRGHDKEGKPLLAPNGQPSNLNRRQWVQVRTPSFKRWFGDWEYDPKNASKVVDANGEPMVMYHGTFDDFSKFDRKKLGDNTIGNANGNGWGETSRVGFWFNTRPMGRSPDKYGAGYTVDMPVFLRLLEPAKYWSVDDLAATISWNNTTGIGLKNRLKRDGFDGVRLNDEEFGGESFVVFDRNKIKSAIGNTGAFDVKNDDIRFSLSPASGGSPLGGQGGAAFLDKAKAALGHRWTQALGSREASPWAVLTLRQLADVGAQWLPGIELYNRMRTRMETRRNVMMEEAGRLGDAMESWARRNRDEAQQVWDLANDSTLAQVDPSAYQTLKVPLQLGPGPEFLRNWEATAENVQELRRRAKVWRASTNARERVARAYYEQAAQKLAKAVKVEAKRRASLPALQQRWAELSEGKAHLDAHGSPFATEVAARAAQAKLPTKEGTVYLIEEVPGGWAIQELGGKQVYTRMRDLYQKRSREMMDALIKRLDSLESLDEETKAVLAARIRAEFENPLDAKGNPRIGPYFPLQRFGNYFLFARRYPQGEARTFRRKDGKPFPSEKAAKSAAWKRADLQDLNLKAVALEDGKSFELVELGEEGFWLFESPAERSQAATELKGEGWTVIRQGLTQEASRALDGVSEGFIADAVTKLKKQGSKEEADTLYQMYLQTLQQMSIRKRFIHRKGTKGYTQDVLRAYGWNMVRQAHQISKLEGMPPLERLLRDIEEGIKTGAQDQPDQDTTRQTALLIELKKRHEAIATPQGSAMSNMMSALGFMFYLGVSPAAALVNLSQVPIVALPELAGRYGSWGGAAKALSAAFVDVARGFTPAVMKGFVTGKPLPSDAANLTDEERSAFAAWSATGVRDRSQAHNLAGIAEADSLLNGPTMNRVMGAMSSLFHASEVLNRDATLLAAYRLARSKKVSHELAIQQAEDATWVSQFDYSNNNRARIMQGNVAKVLLMFKNYAQHVLYFLGRNLFLWAKGESPEVRKEARTKFAGMLGMTALFTGAAGLPIGGLFVIANALQALLGDDDEPWDAETEFRNWLAATFPDPVSGIIDRGAVTRLSGLDFTSRVGIRDLLWRAPDRDLDGKGMYQHVVEQLLGPIGGLAARPFTLADEVADGNWARAAEAVVPKFAKDLMQAGRYSMEGVKTHQGYPVMTAEDMSSYELFWKAMGMQPDALAIRWDANNATKLYEGRITNRRKALITAAAMAMIHKDAEALKLAREEIATFNQANPYVKIGLQTLTRSVRARNMMADRAHFGIVVNPKLAGLRQSAGGFGYTDEAKQEEEAAM